MAAIDEIYRYLNEIAPFPPRWILTTRAFSRRWKNGGHEGFGNPGYHGAIGTPGTGERGAADRQPSPGNFSSLEAPAEQQCSLPSGKERNRGDLRPYQSGHGAGRRQRLSGRRFGAFRTDRGGFLRRASLLCYGNPCPAYGAEKLRGVCKREAFL